MCESKADSFKVFVQPPLSALFHDDDVRVGGINSQGGSADVVTRGWHPVPPSRRPKTYPPGRTCALVGCDTLLSRFNEDPYCWQHRNLSFVQRRALASPPVPAPSQDAPTQRASRPTHEVAERKERVIQLLADGPMTWVELTAALGVTHSQAGTALHHLRAAGWVVCEGPKSLARWRLVGDPGDRGPTYR
jgi:hypothetical protein